MTAEMTEVTKRAPMVNIGTTVEAINAARNAVLDIIGSPGGDQVRIAALDAFRYVVEVKNVTISDCTLYGDGLGAAVDIAKP